MCWLGIGLGQERFSRDVDILPCQACWKKMAIGVALQLPQKTRRKCTNSIYHLGKVVQMKKIITITAAIVLLLVLVAVVALKYFVSVGVEAHARSSLVTVTKVADRAVQELIPNGSYKEAIESAEYIEAYYPLGMVLPESHDFADEYRSERQRQLKRIATALSKATGHDCGTDWQAWREMLVSIQDGSPEADSQPGPRQMSPDR